MKNYCICESDSVAPDQTVEYKDLFYLMKHSYAVICRFVYVSLSCEEGAGLLANLRSVDGSTHTCI